MNHIGSSACEYANDSRSIRQYDNKHGNAPIFIAEVCCEIVSKWLVVILIHIKIGVHHLYPPWRGVQMLNGRTSCRCMRLNIAAVLRLLNHQSQATHWLTKMPSNPLPKIYMDCPSGGLILKIVCFLSTATSQPRSNPPTRQ